MASISVEKQIGNYLSLLSKDQKKTVLTVVKTFADSQQYESLWNDKAFTKEMNQRVKAFEDGSAKVMKFNEMKKAVIANYQSKKEKRK